MVEVLPELQKREKIIVSINDAIGVTTALRFVELCQGVEAVLQLRKSGCWLWGSATKHLRPIFNQTITVSIQY